MHDEWRAQTIRYEPDPRTEPVPSIHALYQSGVLKYIGQSYDTAARIRHHRHKGRGWLEAKPDWERGAPFTVRILPLPELPGEKGTVDEWERDQQKRYWIYHLRPPCNQIPRRPPTL